ncbi:MAG: hypothetical protein II943_12510 [Victivallales bacterium]|nr:hypothetical protein [Victivallales bacterium]
MSFDFTCPFCNQVMQCEDEWRGVQAKCPTCGGDILLRPPSTPSNAGPDLSRRMPYTDGPEPQAAARQAVSNQFSSPKKSGFIKGLLKVILGVIVLIGLAGGGYWYYQENKNNNISKAAEEVFKDLIEDNCYSSSVTSITVADLEKSGQDKYTAKAEVIAYVEGKEEKGTFEIEIDCSEDDKIWVIIGDTTDLPDWFVIAETKKMARKAVQEGLEEAQFKGSLSDVTVGDVSKLGNGLYRGTLFFTIEEYGKKYSRSKFSVYTIEFTLYFSVGGKVEYRPDSETFHKLPNAPGY